MLLSAFMCLPSYNKPSCWGSWCCSVMWTAHIRLPHCNMEWKSEEGRAHPAGICQGLPMLSFCRVQASLSVAFGQRAPNRATAREEGRGLGAGMKGTLGTGPSTRSPVYGGADEERRGHRYAYLVPACTHLVLDVAVASAAFAVCIILACCSRATLVQPPHDGLVMVDGS